MVNSVGKVGIFLASIRPNQYFLLFFLTKRKNRFDATPGTTF